MEDEEIIEVEEIIKGDVDYPDKKVIFKEDVVIEGNLRAKSVETKGDITVKGNYKVKEDDIVNGNQIVYGIQEIGGNQQIEGKQIIGNMEREGGYVQIIRGKQEVKRFQEVRGDQLIEGDQIVRGTQYIDGTQKVKGNQVITRGDQFIVEDRKTKNSEVFGNVIVGGGIDGMDVKGRNFLVGVFSPKLNGEIKVRSIEGEIKIGEVSHKLPLTVKLGEKEEKFWLPPEKIEKILQELESY